MHEHTIITIAGNMGVGKTALSQMLAQTTGWTPFFERVEENPYIADFYNDMSRWSFHSQVFFLSRRLRVYQEMQNMQSRVIQDRGVEEDAEIFAKNLYHRGHMHERDYALYRDLYDECMKLMPMPSFIVYLKASVPTLMTRIAKRGRGYEKNISETYLAELNGLYDEWTSALPAENHITIPVDDLDFVASSEDFQNIHDTITRALL